MKKNLWKVGGLFAIALVFIIVVILGGIIPRESSPRKDDTKTNIELSEDNLDEEDRTKTDAESFDDVFDEEDSDALEPNDEVSKEEETDVENAPSKKEEIDVGNTPSQKEEIDGETTPSKEVGTDTDSDAESEPEDKNESKLSEIEDTETKYGEIY